MGLHQVPQHDRARGAGRDWPARVTAWEERLARQKAIVKQAWELVAVSRNLRWKLLLKREVAKRTASRRD